MASIPWALESNSSSLQLAVSEKSSERSVGINNLLVIMAWLQQQAKCDCYAWALPLAVASAGGSEHCASVTVAAANVCATV